MRPSFDTVFRELTGHAPREYQVRLARRLLEGRPPTVIEIPTGMGKTLAVMTAWLYALAADLEQVREQGGHPPDLDEAAPGGGPPRRRRYRLHRRRAPA